MELKQLGAVSYACEQPDRGLGWSNSGLISAGGGMVVDTLYDLKLTQAMIALYAGVVAAPAERLVNTHHNGDHCWGNQLFPQAEIIAHKGCAARFGDFTPQQAEAIRTLEDPPAHLEELSHEFAPFDFSEVVLTPPTTILERSESYDLDGVRVEVIYVGPAHTEGDLIVYVPDDGVVFAGDVFFHRCTPIGWEGSTEQWIAALERIEALRPETVVPGHGPVCGLGGVVEMKEYLQYVRRESRSNYLAGRSALEAARRIELGPYAVWNEPFRLVANVHRCYREFVGDAWDSRYDAGQVMADMRAFKASFRL